jgi:hypothetical protein
LGGAAVVDLETGLVWERSPDTSDRLWRDTIGHCAQREVGGRKGWHLPLVEQLLSLMDSSNSDSALPTGHPFLNVQPDIYWSATTNAAFPRLAWNVGFSPAHVNDGNKVITFHLAWCVRGGQVFDGNTHDTKH